MDGDTHNLSATSQTKAEAGHEPQSVTSEQRSYDELERRVERRTLQLKRANERLEREIIRRKQIEEKLRETMEEWEAAFNSIDDLVMVVDANFNVTKVNRAFARVFDAAPEQLAGRKCYEILQGTTGSWLGCPVGQVLDHQKPLGEEFYEPRLGKHLQTSISPILNKQGDVIGSVYIVKDITAHQHEEQVLLEKTHDLAQRVKELKCLYGFAEAIATSGFSLDEVCQRLVELIPPGWQYPAIAVARLVLGEKTFQTPGFAETAWKLTSPILVGGEPAGTLEVAYLEERPQAAGGEGPFLKEERALLGGLVNLLGGAIERTRVEEHWRESQRLISAVFASFQGHVAVVDRSARIIAVNEAWLRFAQENQANLSLVNVGVNYLEVCRKAIRDGDSSAAAALQGIEAVLGGAQTEFALEYRCPSSTAERWFEMMVHPLKRSEGGAVIAHLNITNRRQAEIETDLLRRELVHVTRAITMGELTASLAHELRQPLTAILSNAQAGQRLLAAASPDWSEIREILADIVADDQRAGEVIRRLQALLRKGALELQPLDLNDLVQEAAGLVRSDALIHQVSVTLDLAPGLPPLEGDRIQLEQVILNLLVNALEAVRNSTTLGRTLTLRTRRPDAGSVQIAIQDAGPGIPPERLGRIFEPFYTSKPNGLGMGLAICRSIVAAHGGRIWAENNPDQGATFCVRLPIHPQTNR